MREKINWTEVADRVNLSTAECTAAGRDRALIATARTMYNIVGGSVRAPEVANFRLRKRQRAAGRKNPHYTIGRIQDDDGSIKAVRVGVKGL